MPKEEGAANSVEELAALAAVPRRITVHTLDRETDAPIPLVVRVAPMTFDMCGAFSAQLAEVAKTLPERATLNELPELYASHYREIRAMIAVATELSEEYVGSLPADESLKLARVVWEVNRDFFVHRVGPLAKALLAEILGAGLTLSTSSPSTVTPTP